MKNKESKKSIFDEPFRQLREVKIFQNKAANFILSLLWVLFVLIFIYFRLKS